MSNLKFKKNESFYIRDGWFEKAINTISNNPNKNIFSKNEGIHYLGIGSNMVKGLKYWLTAADIFTIEDKHTVLTYFGNLIHTYDKYLEDNFTWYLIHYMLVKKEIDCPVFYQMFNKDLKTFTKNEAVDFLQEQFDLIEPNIKKEYIDADVAVFIKSYFDDNKGDNPEDNYICPLSNLKLLSKKADKYQMTKPLYANLSYLIIYYVLSKLYNFEDFEIEESMYKNNSPLKVFNIDKNMYLQYLEEMKKNGLVTVTRTAGLNTVSFVRKLELDDIFEEYFGGRNYV